MENKINIAELLKDCPSGMELDCTIYEDVTLYRIDTDTENEYPIRIKTKNDYFLDLTNYGTYSNVEEAKCVIFPKGKTTWKDFIPPCQFKDGDIIFAQYYDLKYVSIVKQIDKSSNIHVYCLYGFTNSVFVIDEILGSLTESFKIRFATKEEKKKLFDTIRANGYKWNAETKTLEKLIEPKFKVGDRVKLNNSRFIYTITNLLEDRYRATIDSNDLYEIAFERQDAYKLVPNKFEIKTLKPFESRVLVRDTGHYEWEGAVFGRYDGNTFFTIGGVDWRYCIPYEGNEHLFGTTNDCSSFYKIWEK